MKNNNLNPFLPNIQSDQIGVHSEQQQKKEIKLIDTQRKIKGLALWEFNLTSKILCLTQYKKINFELKALTLKEEDLVLKHKVVVKEGCVYFQALNRKNAIKKIVKNGYNINDIK